MIDAKNNIDAVMDVAIKDGHIAKVAAGLTPGDAIKTIDVKGLYVTPGLIDMHVHVYNGTGERGSYAGDLSVPPDGFTFRTGVTTVVDAGCSGWRNFEDFKDRIIDRSKTRVLAMLNIVGAGMRGGRYRAEHLRHGRRADRADGAKLSRRGRRHQDRPFQRPGMDPVEQAVIAGTRANIPVMVDFGADRPTRPLYDLLTKKLRPGDIYTHMYSGLRQEQDPVTKGPQKGMIEGRARGIWFDTGTGGGSFKWSLAVPLIKQGFKPDSISTDLHVDSMNGATKDMLNVASKMMAIGLTLQEVVAEMTSHPAHQIKHEELGNLSVGAVADVAVLSMQKGRFGFTDMVNTRVDGTQKLVAELTIKDGKIVYDLNGLEALPWDAPQGDIRRTSAGPAGRGRFPSHRWRCTVRRSPKTRTADRNSASLLAVLCAIDLTTDGHREITSASLAVRPVPCGAENFALGNCRPVPAPRMIRPDDVRRRLRLHHRRRGLGRLRAGQPLSADPKNRVLLLEAGGYDDWIWFHIPVGYLYLDRQSAQRLDVRDRGGSRPEGRKLNYPRGKAMGGSSSINAMLSMRGQAGDYDHWRQLGLTGWGWNDVQPVFRAWTGISWATASITARAASFRWTCRGCAGKYWMWSSTRPRRSAFPGRPIPTPATMKAAIISTSTRSAGGAGRRRAAF